MNTYRSSLSSSNLSSPLASPSTPASASMNGFALFRAFFRPFVLMAPAWRPRAARNLRRRTPCADVAEATLVALAPCYRMSFHEGKMLVSKRSVHLARRVAVWVALASKQASKSTLEIVSSYDLLDDLTHSDCATWSRGSYSIGH